jgi:hypothetical protein
MPYTIDFRTCLLFREFPAFRSSLIVSISLNFYCTYMYRYGTSICMSERLSACLYVSLYVWTSTSFCMSVVSLYVCIFLYMSVRFSVCLPMSVCLCGCLCVSLFSLILSVFQ